MHFSYINQKLFKSHLFLESDLQQIIIIMSLKTNKTVIYNKLHRFSILTILGVSAVTAVLFGYNCYLFKKGKSILVLNLQFSSQFQTKKISDYTEGVPMIINKYKSKVEENIELKQREAEYWEQLKRNKLEEKRE